MVAGDASIWQTFSSEMFRRVSPSSIHAQRRAPSRQDVAKSPYPPDIDLAWTWRIQRQHARSGRCRGIYRFKTLQRCAVMMTTGCGIIDNRGRNAGGYRSGNERRNDQRRWISRGRCHLTRQ
jgi:hypothetical protein